MCVMGSYLSRISKQLFELFIFGDRHLKEGEYQHYIKEEAREGKVYADVVSLFNSSVVSIFACTYFYNKITPHSWNYEIISSFVCFPVCVLLAIACMLRLGKMMHIYVRHVYFRSERTWSKIVSSIICWIAVYFMSLGFYNLSFEFISKLSPNNNIVGKCTSSNGTDQFFISSKD